MEHRIAQSLGTGAATWFVMVAAINVLELGGSGPFELKGLYETALIAAGCTAGYFMGHAEAS